MKSTIQGILKNVRDVIFVQAQKTISTVIYARYVNKIFVKLTQLLFVCSVKKIFELKKNYIYIYVIILHVCLILSSQ